MARPVAQLHKVFAGDVLSKPLDSYPQVSDAAQRVCLQGEVVHFDAHLKRMLLDDCTGVLPVYIKARPEALDEPRLGSRVTVVGFLGRVQNSELAVFAPPPVDCSATPDSPAMWILEVLEARKMAQS